jgi:carboxylesterase
MMKIVEKNILPGAEPFFSEGDSTGVLLLHGFTGSPYEMRTLAQQFIDKGNTVSVPLLCGHGTKAEDMLDCRWYDWFTNAKNALFRLRKKCSTVYVAGLSMGASLALHLAAHYQVEGVIALAPGLVLLDKRIALIKYVLPFMTFKKKRGPRADINSEEKNKTVNYGVIPLNAVLELTKFFTHLEMDLPEIYAPVFLAHSKNDHVVSFESSEIIYNKISSKNKQFLRLSESYHVLTLDKEKEILFREISKFVESLNKS